MNVNFYSQKKGFNLLLVILFSIISISLPVNKLNAQVLLTEDFQYTPGTLLTANGYTNFSGTTNYLTVAANSLSYPSSPASGVGGSIPMTTTGSDEYRPLSSAPTSGSVYASFLVNVSAAGTGDYWFSLYTTGAGGGYLLRFNIKSSGSGYVLVFQKQAVRQHMTP